MMKLEPMNKLEANAKMRPVTFSLDRPISKNRYFLVIGIVLFFIDELRQTNEVTQIIIIVRTLFAGNEMIGCCEQPQHY